MYPIGNGELVQYLKIAHHMRSGRQRKIDTELFGLGFKNQTGEPFTAAVLERIVETKRHERVHRRTPTSSL